MKKCIPTTRSGRCAAVAIAVTSSEEVLLASTQSSETIPLDSFANSSRLSSSRSGAASITSPHGARSSSAGAGSSLWAAVSASAWVQRPRAAPRSR